MTQPDRATVLHGQSVMIDVLANDSDPDGDTLDLHSAQQPPNGGGRVDVFGSRVRFTADAGSANTVTFDYRATDGEAIVRGTVTVVVEKPNSPPTARGDSFTIKACDSQVWTLTANDSDPDGDSISIASVSKPSQGSVAIVSGSQVEYRAPCGATAPPPPDASFSYNIRDSAGNTSGAATVSITIA